jgi:hypothetical protein
MVMESKKKLKNLKKLILIKIINKNNKLNNNKVINLENPYVYHSMI